MVGANLKSEINALGEKRAAMEAEMGGIISRLTSPPNGPGISGSLVDGQGFPRADIDIAAVLANRQRLNVLSNDHKAITNKIEQILHSLHSATILPQKRTAEGVPEGEDFRPQRGAPAMESSAFLNVGLASTARREESTAMEENTHPHAPFGIFDEVTEGSPAQRDGLMLGDLVLKFGSVEGGENVLFRLAAEGQRNEGQPIHVVVLRQGVPVQLSLTPRGWSGRGLLGCHIREL